MTVFGRNVVMRRLVNDSNGSVERIFSISNEIVFIYVCWFRSSSAWFQPVYCAIVSTFECAIFNWFTISEKNNGTDSNSSWKEGNKSTKYEWHCPLNHLSQKGGVHTSNAVIQRSWESNELKCETVLQWHAVQMLGWLWDLTSAESQMTWKEQTWPQWNVYSNWSGDLMIMWMSHLSRRKSWITNSMQRKQPIISTGLIFFKWFFWPKGSRIKAVTITY